MTEAKDFIESDPFDPAIIEQYEQTVKPEEASVSDAEAYLRRRKLAYAAVFTEGARTQDDINIVLADLIWFCKLYVPTFDIKDGIHAENLSKIKEGRREVIQRILNFSRLDLDALFLKYTAATTQQG